MVVNWDPTKMYRRQPKLCYVALRGLILAVLFQYDNKDIASSRFIVWKYTVRLSVSESYGSIVLEY